MSTTTKTNVSEEMMKPYEVTIDELKSFDSKEDKIMTNELTQENIKCAEEHIRNEINNINIDFTIPHRMDVELKYFDSLVNGSIEISDVFREIGEKYSDQLDQDEKQMLVSLSVSIKNIMKSFEPYKTALLEGNATKAEYEYKHTLSNAIIELMHVYLPYYSENDIEAMLQYCLDTIKKGVATDFDVEKTSKSYEELISTFDQVKAAIANQFAELFAA